MQHCTGSAPGSGGPERSTVAGRPASWIQRIDGPVRSGRRCGRSRPLSQDAQGTQHRALRLPLVLLFDQNSGHLPSDDHWKGTSLSYASRQCSRKERLLKAEVTLSANQVHMSGGRSSAPRILSYICWNSIQNSYSALEVAKAPFHPRR